MIVVDCTLRLCGAAPTKACYASSITAPVWLSHNSAMVETTVITRGGAEANPMVGRVRDGAAQCDAAGVPADQRPVLLCVWAVSDLVPQATHKANAHYSVNEYVPEATITGLRELAVALRASRGGCIFLAMAPLSGGLSMPVPMCIPFGISTCRA